MSQFLSIILPFLGLIAAGFSAAKWLGLPAQGVSGLNLFVYYFALPAWFFQLVAETSFHDLPGWSFVIITTFATYCAFAIAFSFGALLNRENQPEFMHDMIQAVRGGNTAWVLIFAGVIVAPFGEEMRIRRGDGRVAHPELRA